MKLKLLFPFLLVCELAIGQTFQLSGTIPDENLNSEIGQVTIFSLPDSVLIKGSYIDTSFFSINVPEVQTNDYFAKFRFPGYIDTIINFKRSEEEVIDLGIITLQKDLTLNEVEIVYRKPIYERSIDGIEVNVEGTTLETLDNLFEVLKASPKIMSPDDESIEIIGKGVPLILIDRQPILSTEELKAIPANMIDRIEIITNPSSKYRAQGRENGVIEVYTKNYRLEGYNMSINAQGGIITQLTPIGSLGIGLSLKKGKFSMSGSLYGRYLEQTNYGSLDREIFDSTNRTTAWDYTENYNQFSENINIKSAYQINENQTISAGVRGTGFTKNSNSIWSGYYYTDGLPQTKEDQEAEDTFTWLNSSAFLNYLCYTDSNNSNLEINLNYQLKIIEGSIIHYTDYEDIPTSTFQDFNLRNNSRNRPNVGETRVTYEHIFDTTGWSLSAGGFYSIVFNKMEFDVLNLIDNNWVVDPIYSNSYDYDEHIGGAFVEVTKAWEKLSVRGGIRGEYTVLNGYSHSLSQQFMDSSYVLPFPSASMMYQPNDKLAITLRYTSGISRPQFFNFDPFVRVADSLTIEYGNPYLKPATTQNFGLDLDLFQALRLSVEHNLTFQPTATRMFIEDSSFLFVFTPSNADRAERTTLSLGFPLRTKWMDGWTYLNVAQNTFKFTSEFNLPDITNFTYVLWSSLNFYLKGNVTIRNQIYLYKQAYLTNSQDARFRWNLQITKRMFNNKLTISLKASDILPPKLNYVQQATNYVTYGSGQDLFTDFQIGILYKFGRLKRDPNIKETESGQSDRL